MSVLDLNNISDSFLESIEDRFWKTIMDTLRHVFKIEPPRWEPGNPRELDLVERYRMAMSAASISEKILTYHLDPFDVAADLAGVEITDDHLTQYDRSVQSILPNEDPR
jgi:hypothetical protein